MINIAINKKFKGNRNEFELKVNFDFSEGEVIGVYGKSGAGKSSLLRAICGFETVDEGFIKINNKIWLCSEKKINIPTQKRRIGLLSQEYNLFPNFNIEQNILFSAPKNYNKELFHKLINTAGVNELLKEFPYHLSGGQQQRIALIRALMREPQLLLLDEPFSALDKKMRDTLLDLLITFKKSLSFTCLFVSHDVSDLQKIADIILHLEDGKVIDFGRTNKLFAKSNISGKYKIIGKVVTIQKSDLVFIVEIIYENSLMKIIATEDEIKNVNIGDNVVISAKAFNPIFSKI